VVSGHRDLVFPDVEIVVPAGRAYAELYNVVATAAGNIAARIETWGG
jgi:hypothetical protein